MLNYKYAIAALGICTLSASLSHAASIPLSNAGFESSWSDWSSEDSQSAGFGS